MEDTTKTAQDIVGKVEDSGQTLIVQKPIITEPEIITLYDTQTGEPSKFRVYTQQSLITKLRQKRADGSLVFTTFQPSIIPKRGNLKCMLHAKDPNREKHDAMGLPVCLKDNLTSYHQVKRHMQKKHPMEWETIEAERIKTEREEDRVYQKATLKALSDMTILAEESSKEKSRVGRPKKT